MQCRTEEMVLDDGIQEDLMLKILFKQSQGRLHDFGSVIFSHMRGFSVEIMKSRVTKIQKVQNKHSKGSYMRIK